MIGIIFSILMVSMAFANSGPIFWQGFPSSEIMAIDENSPIAINGEDLIFDFSQNMESGFTITGEVTASYHMVNPTNEIQNVQMAFPFVGSLDNLSRDNTVITVDNTLLPYDIYIGNIVDSRGNPSQDEVKPDFDFEKIIASISNDTYNAKNFDYTEKGKLYNIKVCPTTDQRVNFAVDFNFNQEKTKVITKGINRYERNDEKTRIAAWCNKPENLEIFVLGKDIDFKFNGYADGDLEEKTDLFTAQVSTQEMEINQYLMDYVSKESQGEFKNLFSSTQLYNLYASSLDKDLSQNMGYAWIQEILGQEYSPRILTLVYTVQFPPQSEKNVSVSYEASGTMDNTQTADPLYSFDYILNPAKNWKDFQNLNIEVITSKQIPYIVEGSIEFKNPENNRYTATLSELPKEDLSFTLYNNESIGVLDKIEGKLWNHFRSFTPIIVGLIVLSIIIVALFIFKKIKKKHYR